MLTYQYLRQLPEIAQGDANKVWVIPAELTAAMSSLTQAFDGAGRPPRPPRRCRRSRQDRASGNRSDSGAIGRLSSSRWSSIRSRVISTGQSSPMARTTPATTCG